MTLVDEKTIALKESEGAGVNALPTFNTSC
jgi:hypothetical protein